MANGWPRHPVLYEINTRVWVRELSARAGKRLTLDTIPPEEIERIAALGFDAVWLMGVWTTGLAAIRLARTDAGLRVIYRRALPDLTDGDIIGSPYAVSRYQVSADLGGPAALASLRASFATYGMRLMLDFVPNHTATDHALLTESPHAYVCGSEDDIARHPEAFFRTRGGPHHRPRARSLFRALAGHGPGGLRASPRPGGHAGPAPGHRPPVRRRALRHGHAAAARRHRANLGRPDRHGLDHGELLDGGDPRRARAPPRFRVHGRVLLGPRVGAPAAGLRLHLRQGALRPPARRRCAGRARPPPRGSRLPRPRRALPGEPRRAAGGRRLRRARRVRTRARHVPRSRPAPAARGPARRPAHQAARPARPPSRRAGGRDGARVLRPGAGRPARSRAPPRELRAARRLARPRRAIGPSTASWPSAGARTRRTGLPAWPWW